MPARASPRKSSRPCKVCNHREFAFISTLLSQGISPRNMAQRIGDLSRRDLKHHLATCKQAKED